jgi:hypothetical protein
VIYYVFLSMFYLKGGKVMGNTRLGLILNGAVSVIFNFNFSGDIIP